MTQLLRRVERQLTEVRDVFLENVAERAVQESPVDTGAYVTSHTITTVSGGGRSRTSHNKPKNQDEKVKKDEARDQLLSDIAALPADATKVYFTNRSPHAKFVEDRHENGGVFTIVRNVAPYLLEQAVLEVRSRT